MLLSKNENDLIGGTIIVVVIVAIICLVNAFVLMQILPFSFWLAIKHAVVMAIIELMIAMIFGLLSESNRTASNIFAVIGFVIGASGYIMFIMLLMNYQKAA